MHLSLKSSLGRQYLDDAMGNKLLSQFGGAAAAYSLRNLTGNGGDVVRVRRESDNAERDFTARDITSGDLVNWVNRQLVPPLDIGVETSDGRPSVPDGGTSIGTPAAAYSLRSLGEAQADDITPSGDTVTPSAGAYVVQVRRNVNGDVKSFTADEVADGTLTSFVNESFTSSLPLDVAGSAAAAYGLRNLSSGYSGNVVEVRRSSDDNVRSFTASEVSDGTLEGWVNTDVSFSAGETFFGLSAEVINASPTAFDATANGSSFDVRAGNQNYTDIVSGEVTVTFTASNFSSSQNIDFQVWTPTGTATYITAGTITGNGDYTFTFNVTGDGTGSIFRFKGSGLTTGDTLSVSGLSLSYTKASGFVQTWYDQSGNDNHATQATPAGQPKIVEGGSYLGELEFDGSQFFDSISLSDSAQPNSIFTVSNTNVDSQTRGIYGTNVNQAGYYRSSNKHAIFSSGTGSSTLEGSAYVVDRDYLRFDLFNGASSVVGVDGNTASGTTGDAELDRLDIGDSTLSGVNPLNGAIKELILYASDQSDKRRAIEESIATANGITLGSFSRDGFVRTWYDQSTNDNHATQTDADEQPKIVDGGSLVTGGGIAFDGTNDKLNFTALNASDFSFFSVVKFDSVSSQRRILASKVGNDTGFGIQNQANGFFKTSDATAFIMPLNATLSTSGDFLYSANRASNTVGFFTNGVASDTITDSLAYQSDSIGGDFRSLDGNLKEIIIYASDQSDNRTAIEANIGEHYSITGIPAYDNTVNGFVETWYDQSGNGNHATQLVAANQPKIVNGGSLVTGGIEFDGSNDFLDLGSAVDFNSTNSNFIVWKQDQEDSAVILLSEDNDGSGTTQIDVRSSSVNYRIGGSSNNNFISATTDMDSLNVFSFLRTTSSSYSAFRNGTSLGTDTNTLTTNSTFRYIGSNSTAQIDGLVSEIIVYDSDQSANRLGIETNINNHYDIYS